MKREPLASPSRNSSGRETRDSPRARRHTGSTLPVLSFSAAAMLAQRSARHKCACAFDGLSGSPCPPARRFAPTRPCPSTRAPASNTSRRCSARAAALRSASGSLRPDRRVRSAPRRTRCANRRASVDRDRPLVGLRRCRPVQQQLVHLAEVIRRPRVIRIVARAPSRRDPRALQIVFALRAARPAPGSSGSSTSGA